MSSYLDPFIPNFFSQAEIEARYGSAEFLSKIFQIKVKENKKLEALFPNKHSEILIPCFPGALDCPKLTSPSFSSFQRFKERLSNAKLKGSLLKEASTRISIEEIRNYVVVDASKMYSDYLEADELGLVPHPAFWFIRGSSRPFEAYGFPVFWEDYLISFIWKIVHEETPLFKYAHSVPWYTFWGIDQALKEKKAILVEGIFDAIALRSLGFTAITASSARLSTLQFALLLRLNQLDLLLDSDFSGYYSSVLNYRVLKKLNPALKLSILTIEEAKDPYEAFREKKLPSSVIKHIEEKEVLRRMRELYPTFVPEKAKILEELARQASCLKNERKE